MFADVSTSSIRFSILSPDASLSYDCIKLRLQEYKDLLATDSPTIEFKTEKGKVVLCRKKVDKMEGFLSEAEQLLQGMVDTPDVSTTTVIYRLRYLAQLLDELQLESECRLVGDCAIQLSQAFSLHSPDFRREQAQTIACIAGLGGYHRQVPTLFTRAVAICDEIVLEDDSALNKLALLDVLSRAGSSSAAYPDLGAQWGGRAIQLMTKVDRPTMITNVQLGISYFNYGQHLSNLRKSSEAIDAYRKAVSYYRTSAMEEANKTEFGRDLINSIMRHEPGTMYGDKVEIDIVMALLAPITRRWPLADALIEYGACLLRCGQYSTAARIGREAVLHYSALVIVDPAQYCKDMLIHSLKIVFSALKNLGNFGEPAAFQVEGISVIRSRLAQDSAPHSAQLTWQLAFCETNLALLEKVFKAKGPEEVILLYSVQFMDDPAEHRAYLATSLELYASFLTQLDKYNEAAASREIALSVYRSLVSHNSAKNTIALINALWKYWSLLKEMGRVTEAVEIGREMVACLQTVVKSQPELEEHLTIALHNLGWEYATLGQHANAIPAFEKSISLWRDLVTKDAETHTWGLANSIHDMAISLHALECHEQAELAAANCIQLCQGKTLKKCQYEPSLDQCFVCSRVAVVASPSRSAEPKSNGTPTLSVDSLLAAPLPSEENKNRIPGHSGTASFPGLTENAAPDTLRALDKGSEVREPPKRAAPAPVQTKNPLYPNLPPSGMVQSVYPPGAIISNSDRMDLHPDQQVVSGGQRKGKMSVWFKKAFRHP